MKRLLRVDSLLALLALVLAATVVMGRETPTLETVNPAGEPAAKLDLSLAERESLAVPAQAGDPFAVRDFNPPPPAPRVVAPPPPAIVAVPAEAPRLPFRYVGRLVDESTIVLLLAHGEEILSAQPGQTVGGQWRVEEVTDQEVRFTYLPLKTRQSLPL
jgi:hypothetical protein